MRLIDGDELLTAFPVDDEPTLTKACVRMTIQHMPTIEPRKGKWIERESGTEDKENGFDTVIVCSCCDFPATTFYSEDCESRTQIRTDFCPNCGTQMTEGEE